MADSAISPAWRYFQSAAQREEEKVFRFLTTTLNGELPAESHRPLEATDIGCVSMQGLHPKSAHFKGVDVIMLREVLGSSLPLHNVTITGTSALLACCSFFR